MSRPNTIGTTQSIESDEWSDAPLDDRLVMRRYDAETAQRTARVTCLAASFRLGICLRTWSSSAVSNSAIRSVQTSSDTFLYSAFFQHPVQVCLTSRAASSACMPAAFSDGIVAGSVHICTGHRRARELSRPLQGLEGEETTLWLGSVIESYPSAPDSLRRPGACPAQDTGRRCDTLCCSVQGSWTWCLRVQQLSSVTSAALD